MAGPLIANQLAFKRLLSLLTPTARLSPVTDTRTTPFSTLNRVIGVVPVLQCPFLTLIQQLGLGFASRWFVVRQAKLRPCPSKVSTRTLGTLHYREVLFFFKLVGPFSKNPSFWKIFDRKPKKRGSLVVDFSEELNLLWAFPAVRGFHVVESLCNKVVRSFQVVMNFPAGRKLPGGKGAPQ